MKGHEEGPAVLGWLLLAKTLSHSFSIVEWITYDEGDISQLDFSIWSGLFYQGHPAALNINQLPFPTLTAFLLTFLLWELGISSGTDFEATNLYSQQAIQVPHFMPQPPLFLKIGLLAVVFYTWFLLGINNIKESIVALCSLPGGFHSMLVIDQWMLTDYLSASFHSLPSFSFILSFHSAWDTDNIIFICVDVACKEELTLWKGTWLAQLSNKSLCKEWESQQVCETKYQALFMWGHCLCSICLEALLGIFASPQETFIRVRTWKATCLTHRTSWSEVISLGSASSYHNHANSLALGLHWHTSLGDWKGWCSLNTRCQPVQPWAAGINNNN